MSIVQSLPKNKPLVIFVIIAIVGVTTVPSLAPHFFHGMHIVDLVMHQAGIALASVLAFLSLNSYIMTKSKKMLIGSHPHVPTNYFMKKSNYQFGIPC